MDWERVGFCLGEEPVIIENMDCYKLFTGPCNDKVRVSSDTGFWRDILHSLVDSEANYCKSLWNILSALEERIDSPHIALKAKNCLEYRKFLQVIANLRNHITDKGHMSCTMRDMYLQHLQELERQSTIEREEFDVRINEKAYNDLQKTFREQEKLVEQFKERYHKLVADVENKELQYLFRSCESARAQLKKDIKSSEDRAKQLHIDYNHSVRIAKNKLMLLKSTSKLFEEAWKEREIRKTDLIVKTLDSIRRDPNHNIEANGSTNDVQIDIPCMVNDLKEVQQIPNIEFQEYQKPILKLVQSKLMTKYSTIDQSHSFEYDNELVKRYVVTRPHKDKNPHCLLLKKGMKITELIAPTSKGWAFGEARKSEHSTPKFGFFHIACVQKV